MSFTNYVRRFIFDPVTRFGYLSKLGVFNFVDDTKYLKKMFRLRCGYDLDLDNPKTYNEKLQYLKLFDRNPEYSNMVDKYEVKKIIEKKIGQKYIIPTLGLWNSFDDIEFDKLPNQFVLKCTHDSGGVVICKDKRNFDYSKARKTINESLKRNYYYLGREWPYKQVEPRIIAEKYMVDESGVELKDYKVFNFNGEPRLIQVDYGRFSQHKRNLYTCNWEYVNASIKYPTDKEVFIKKPEKLEEMLKLASVLSKGIPHIRTDFYSIGNNIYFGELTFYHGSGFEKFTPESFGRKMGDWIVLPEYSKTVK